MFYLQPLQCLTTAPSDYDWGWTKELATNVFNSYSGKIFRLVEVEDQYHFDMQVGRYYSGSHLVIESNETLLKELNSEFISPTNAAKHIYRHTFDFENIVHMEPDKIDLYLSKVEELKKNPNLKIDLLKGGLGLYIEYKEIDKNGEKEFLSIVNDVLSLTN